MRKPPLAHCMSFFAFWLFGRCPAVKQQLQPLSPPPFRGKSVSDKMYFNQKIIVINNRWGEARRWRFVFLHKQRVFIFHVVEPNCCYFCGYGRVGRKVRGVHVWIWRGRVFLKLRWTWKSFFPSEKFDSNNLFAIVINLIFSLRSIGENRVARNAITRD